jgi:hypothetical protein
VFAWWQRGDSAHRTIMGGLVVWMLIAVGLDSRVRCVKAPAG